jgi:hypothetical protein
MEEEKVKKHLAKLLRQLKKDAYDKAAAEKLTRCLAKSTIGFGFEIILTGHFHDELHKDGCDMLDAMKVLENGRIFMVPEYSEEHDNIVYRIEGKTVDGDNAAVCEVILGDSVDNLSLKLVTFFKQKT